MEGVSDVVVSVIELELYDMKMLYKLKNNIDIIHVVLYSSKVY